MASPVYLIGPLPPPVHGMAIAFQSVVARLERDGLASRICNTSGDRLNRSLGYLWRRAWRHLGIAAKILAGPPGGSAYLCLSAGWGLGFDVSLIAACRLRGIKLVMHHHSFAYLRDRRVLAALVFRAAGAAAHIALGRRMAAGLHAIYRIPEGQLITISNAGLMPEMCAPPRRRSIRRIGFLSNLIPGKGLDKVLAIARAISESRLPVELVIAGPCEDAALRSQIAAATGAGLCTWLGPVYGEAKADFFAAIDAFLFPTNYVNEAEPLVIWEALMNGIPVIAYDRGCIEDQVGAAGLIVPADDDFVSAAMLCLASWVRAPATYEACAATAFPRYCEERQNAVLALSRLTAILRRPSATMPEPSRGLTAWEKK
jgi:glycosyltransferase involved in cell wall biosynthesis